jgi:hypothetical protein
VVLDFGTLFGDAAFMTAVEQFRSGIIGFGQGIGRYGNTQREVVIELASVQLSALHAWGGFTLRAERYAAFFWGPNPTPEQIREIENIVANAGQKLGQRWVSRTTNPEAVSRLEQQLVYHAQRLQPPTRA